MIASAPGIQFGLGDGKGDFAKGKSLTIPGTNSQGETCVAPIDIDGDGKVELLVEWGHYSDGKGNIRLYKEQGDMNWVDIAQEAGLPAKGLSIKAFGDLNHDGNPDLVVLQEDRTLAVYLNDGRGHFTKKEKAIDAPVTAAQYLSWGLGAVTDFDNDGVADVLVCGRNFLRLLRGAGDGTFTVMNKAWKVTDIGHGDSGLCFGDINEDGMLDIVGFVAGRGEQSQLGVFRNDLAKQNYLRVRPVGLAGNKGAAGAKIRLTESGSQSGGGKLLWYEQVAIFGRQQNQTYYGLGQTERHFGLGKRDTVDVSVEFYPSGKKVEQKGVKANATIIIVEQ